MDKRSLKKISPFTNEATFQDHRSKFQPFPMKQLWLKAPNIHFMMTMGGKFILYNTDFEEGEKELIDIFNSSSESLSNTSNIKTGSYNKAFPFKPIPTDASPDNPTDENITVPNADS
ncbi:hypothetical protein TNIN_380221 [Trichonephila inaurata madagascariensis]|uniref:Uncharacterized protein n=1 Tax=Trichonephila inaurata madagascariensis TaxID=2747483 RepID=A0A8X7CNE9_9ARAC|nr:hypothetical protein TNIN_380221 [Trichonephila inaurata madagascariensis]